MEKLTSSSSLGIGAETSAAVREALDTRLGGLISGRVEALMFPGTGHSREKYAEKGGLCLGP